MTFSFFRDIIEAKDLKKEFFMKNVYMIGNTHFDPVWLWRWDEAMASIHSTFRSALDRMTEDESR